MYTNIHKLREKLQSGQPLFAAGISLCDPIVVEALAETVDLFWIDLEHSPINFETLVSHLIAARAGGAPALVRIPSGDVAWIKRVLDIGAEGIICPQLATVDSIRQFVSNCRYPPAGTRGFGPRRPTNYGRISGDAYLEHANREVFVTVQIEHVELVDQLDEIVAIDGLDCIAIGPNDLSGTMGKLGKIKDPEVLAVIQKIIDKSRAAGIPVGVGMGTDLDYARTVLGMGASWVQCGGDCDYMLQFATQVADGVHGR